MSLDENRPRQEILQKEAAPASFRQVAAQIIIDDEAVEAVEARIREKAESRMRDFERLRRGEVTAEELQRENSIFPPGWVENVVIENHYDAVGR